MQVDTYAQLVSGDSNERKGILWPARSGLIGFAVAIALAALFVRIMRCFRIFVIRCWAMSRATL